MTFVKNFNEINETDLPIVGGKALNLGKLTQANFAVPIGFCVTTSAFREAINATNSDLAKTPKIPKNVRTAVLSEYEKIAENPVAVRSSATAEDLPTASFAGLQDTFLNVETAEKVIEKIELCWASLWNDRAIAYRRDQQINDDQVAMAVVIQAMIQSDVSGVMFTVNPIGTDEIVIESNWGLGESVVSGEVTPDHFLVSKSDQRTVSETISTKNRMFTRDGVIDVPIGQRYIPSLNRTQVAELAQIGVEIEKFYASPQDIEWAFHDEKFYILQSRPITTLTDTAQIERLRRREVETLHQKAEPEGTIWSRYNLAEVLPAPLPITWSIIREFMSGTGGFGLAYRDLGFMPSKRIGPEGILDLICGRIYFNLSREIELYFHGFPFEYNFAKLRREPQNAIYPQPTINLKSANFSFFFKFPYFLIRMPIAELKIRKLRKNFDEKLNNKIFPEFENFVKTAKEIDLTQLYDSALIAKFHEWRKFLMIDFSRDALKGSIFAGFSHQQLDLLLKKFIDDPEKAEEFSRSLITADAPDSTIETHLAIWSVAEGKSSIAEFLDRFGHRSVGEFELAQPRWHEDASYIERLIESFRDNPSADPNARLADQKGKHENAAQSLKRDLTQTQFKMIDRELELTKRYMTFRESWKHIFMLGYDLLRRTLLEIDRRFDLDESIFYLTADEINLPFDREKMIELIDHRRTERNQLLRIELPDVIYSDALHRIGEPVPIEVQSEMSGRGVSVGVSTGIAKVLLDPNEPIGSDRDYVLVCPSTDPGWTPLFLNASALVMERGGLLSHGAIVAREYGIPAVVGIFSATKRIRSGQRLRVDGTRGKVFILDDDDLSETTNER